MCFVSTSRFLWQCPIANAATKFVCLNFHNSRPVPILPQHEESRQRGISRNVEESRPCWSCSSTKNLVHDNGQEVGTLNYFSRGIFLGHLVHDWARTSFGSGIRRGSFCVCVCGPEWTSSHQCTSWPFCPLDGLHFFIQRRMGFISVHFFLPLTTVLFFFWFLAVLPWTWPHT
jgi:hypothetical protein